MAGGKDPFETTLHKTNEWLATIMQRLSWEDRFRAWAALRSVLHVLRDRLTVEEAAALGAQLPLLIRGLYYEGWVPTQEHERIKQQDELAERIAQGMRGYQEVIDPNEVMHVVIDVLTEHISKGAVDHLTSVLPRDLRPLFNRDHAHREPPEASVR